MPETLYHYRGDQWPHRAGEFQICGFEANGGNFAVKARSLVELSLEVALGHRITLTRFFSRNAAELHWRRTAEIIRTHGGDFYLFRFLVAGRMQVVTSRETLVLEEGDFSISRGDVPYLSKSLPNVHGEYEAFQIYVPLHLIAHRLPDEGLTGSFSCATPSGSTANALLGTLFRYGEHVDISLRDRLVDALLEALIGCVRHERNVQPRREGISKTRLSAIIQFVHDNGMQHGLSASIVAKECGVSRRYLSSLLAREGVHFKELLRDVRLAHAEALLASLDAEDRTIGEVASLCGFESPAYFSRVFKSTRGISPRQFRGERQAVPFRARVEGGEPAGASHSGVLM